MNSTLSKVLIFIAGAGVGSAVTWKLVKNKYERIAQEEIDSVKETFGKSSSGPLAYKEEPEEVEEDNEVDETVRKEYYDTVSALGYAQYSKKKETDNVDDHPYVIPPDEFGEFDEYGTETLIYHRDGVLTDLEENLIDDVDGLVGERSLSCFGDYEDDSVHVRNDRTQTDYEILMVDRDYYPRPTEE